MGGRGIFSYFGALDPNLRKGWTEADDAALREAMTDENIDRFLLARRLGKSMDMVRDGFFSNHLIGASLIHSPGACVSQLRKRIRIFSRAPKPKRRRVLKNNDKRTTASRLSKSKGGKKRKRNAMEDDSEEWAEDDESEDGGEWQGDEMDTDDDDTSEVRANDAKAQVQAGESTLSTRRSTRRYAAERRTGGD